MFVIDIEYIVPLSTIEKIVEEHRSWLDVQFNKGLLLCSGPKNPRTGGVVIAFGSDKSQIEQLFTNDPYYINKAAKYSFTEFMPIKQHKEVQNLLKNQ